MKKQAYNPYLPLTEYVPDGEPHVFGDRVYVYGSHDEARSTRFCVRDYTVWSAPVDDLSDWSCHGVTYRKDQDPRSTPGRLVDYYAPDCVQGNDGKYYLYYSAMGPNVKNFGPMSVAVSESPAGPFEYLGDIRNADGTPLLKFLNNDPAVLNDNGRIWLYYGWGLGRDFRNKLCAPVLNNVQSQLFDRSIAEIKATKPSIMSCAVVELEEDMLTVKTEPKAVLDSKTTAPKGSQLYEHPFYEAASIRKFGELYYLVYSCGADNGLAYATSKYPDKDFSYRGIIISNADLGYQGNRTPIAPAGTIHGGMEFINGQHYIFYHRSTNNTDFSRQTCAEPIDILPDGTIKQVEVTSCGLNGGPLKGVGIYPAAICCNLTCGQRIPIGVGKGQKFPRVDEADGQVFVHDMTEGTQVGYKYFAFEGTKELKITYRGTGKGVLEVSCGEKKTLGEICKVIGTLPLESVRDWQEVAARLKFPKGIASLFFKYHGTEKIDLLKFEFV